MKADPADLARHGDAAALAAALRASRADTLATFDAYLSALGPAAPVPRDESFNPPLWELGHIGWFQDAWIARNRERPRGWDADPTTPRAPPSRADADALYDSSHVPHDTRWSLPLPDADATRDDLAAQLERTLALLAEAPHDDRALYFHRLVLLHEDMHHEAALYMARALEVPIDDPRWQPRPLDGPRRALGFDAGPWRLGSAGGGFAFDNELHAHERQLGACRIDSRVLCWSEYLPFAEAGGYRDARWWGADGAAWLAARTAAGEPPGPRYLRRADGGWEERRAGRWRALDPRLPACHLTRFEAEAWCAWAGRRLPTEAEWERAALQQPADFAWGSVWEWTTSDFAPYPGFVAHPYRDYSAPWFDGRPVLRGASFATQPRLRHARYRNYFPAGRSDIFAGFRTCER